MSQRPPRGGTDGVLVVDKPAGITSHDVVARVRRLAGQRRVGHAGTLDPPATGVLVVTLGKVTRLLPYLPLEPKGYRATIRFGRATDTLDATGQTTGTAPAAHITQEAVAAALERFVGPQEQIPPMVSAVKVGGERLYAKARRGEEIQRDPRPITIHTLELVSFDAGDAGDTGDTGDTSDTGETGRTPSAVVDVSCSGGTYVRVLAADLGETLGTRAHLEALRRTAVGPFHAEDVRTLETLTDASAAGDLAAHVITPAAAMTPTGTRHLTAEETAALAVGRPLAPTGIPTPVAAVSPDGTLIAVIQDEAGRARPKVVLA